MVDLKVINIIVIGIVIGIAIIICLTPLLFLFGPLKKRVTSKTHYALLTIFSALVVQFITAPIRGYVNMEASSVVGFICYLIATNFFLTRYRNKLKTYQTILCILAGIFVIQLPPRLLDDAGLISIPDLLTAILGVFAGYFFYNRHRFVHKLNLSLSALIVLFTFFYGYKLWAHNLAFGNTTGNVIIKGPTSVNLVSNKAEPIKMEKGKITVLDFWFIGCGACVDEFPDFQKTYNQYKSNPKIQFYSVNSQFPRDTGLNSFKMLTNLGYNFPMAMSPNASLAKSLDIFAYPAFVILDENGNVVYKGSYSGVDEKIKSLL